MNWEEIHESEGFKTLDTTHRSCKQYPVHAKIFSSNSLQGVGQNSKMQLYAYNVFDVKRADFDDLHCLD